MAMAAGVAARVQGLERYYALLLSNDGVLRLIKRLDGERVLADHPWSWQLDQPYDLELAVRGDAISAYVGDEPVFAIHDQDRPLLEGAIALVAEEGRVDVADVAVGPL
jgi:hypothetical protein